MLYKFWQACYRCVTSFSMIELQGCYECVTSVLWVCYKCVLRLLQMCVTSFLWVRYKCVTSVLQVFYKSVTHVLQVSYKWVASVLRVCIYIFFFASLLLSANAQKFSVSVCGIITLGMVLLDCRYLWKKVQNLTTTVKYLFRWKEDFFKVRISVFL